MAKGGPAEIAVELFQELESLGQTLPVARGQRGVQGTEMQAPCLLVIGLGRRELPRTRVRAMVVAGDLHIVLS